MAAKKAREADPDADPSIVGINNPTAAEFNITDCKFYVPTVTLPTEYETR